MLLVQVEVQSLNSGQVSLHKLFGHLLRNQIFLAALLHSSYIASFSIKHLDVLNLIMMRCALYIHPNPLSKCTWLDITNTNDAHKRVFPLVIT